MSLLDDLEQGKQTSTLHRTCKACKAIDDAPEDAREALSAALAGSIGRDKLAAICKTNGLDVTRWSIDQHRMERHAS